MALGSTKPVTETSIRSISSG